MECQLPTPKGTGITAGMDGYEVANRIRSAPACSAAVLIALTGYGQTEYRVRAESAGFHGYLVKPVDTAELEKLIACASAEYWYCSDYCAREDLDVRINQREEERCGSIVRRIGSVSACFLSLIQTRGRARATAHVNA